jgi:hypothetical protein
MHLLTVAYLLHVSLSGRVQQQVDSNCQQHPVHSLLPPWLLLLLLAQSVSLLQLQL